MGYPSEAELFKKALKSSFISNNLKAKTAIKFVEPNGLFGIPDLLIAKQNRSKEYYSIAFEMKLRNWKRALKQAYRYKSFSEYSYVLMDNECIDPALKQIDLFKKSNIGLLGIDNKGTIYRYFIPQKDLPYFKAHKLKLLDMIEEKSLATC